VFAEVPVLPVVVPLAAAVFASLLVYLRQTARLSAPRAVVALALCVYAAGIVANTVFPIFLDKPRASAPWNNFIAATPIVGYGVSDAVMNMCVFLPIGMLVPLISSRPTWPRVLTVATTVSLAIEVSQYVTARLLGGGHIADVNDLLFNVVGAALGYGVFRGLLRVPGTARLIDSFRWTRGPTGGDQVRVKEMMIP
jgi:glycopeptide antibiotics resistance protein